MRKTEFDPLEETLVEVAGMGGTINPQVALLHAVLELAGYEVECINANNKEGSHWYVCKEEMKQKILNGTLDIKVKDKIKLVARHIPWPG